MSLIAVDLDGTLLRSDLTISDRTHDVLRLARSRGFTVVPATARPPRFLKQLALDPGIFDVAICCNGALVFDVEQWRILDHASLDPREASLIAARLRESIPEICFAVEMGLRYGWESDYASLPGALVNPDGIVADAENLLSEPVTKLIARHPTLAFDSLLEAVGALKLEGCEITHSSTDFIEISRRGVDKAAALVAFATGRGLSSADVVAFGDMPNDLPMLRWAGRSIAVANAHPDVLTAADEVTSSNDADGVAQVIEDLIAVPGRETELVR